MKLTQEAKQRQAEWIAQSSRRIEAVKTAIYVMIGGGLLASSALNQPGSFYIDSRVGRLPYPRKDILQAVEILALVSQLTPIGNNLSDLPNLGVF